MRSRPRFAAYVIGGPQLLSVRIRTCSWISAGLRVMSARTVSGSSRQIASASCTAWTSRVQLDALVAPCEHELRVGQLRGRRVDRFGMVLAQFGDRIRIAGVDGAEEFLGLTMKLLEVGPDGQAADGHDEPPCNEPVVRWRRAKEVRRSRPNVWLDPGASPPEPPRHRSRGPRAPLRSAGRAGAPILRWTQSCPRTGGALQRLAIKLPRAAWHTRRVAPAMTYAAVRYLLSRRYTREEMSDAHTA